MTLEEEIALRELLWEARDYIDNSDGDLDVRADLVERIEKICPPPPKIEYCTREMLCCLPKGHGGDCDDIAF